MAYQHRFRHACGHIGIGPIFHHRADLSNILTKIATVHISLEWDCPFCLSPSLHDQVKPSEGLFVVLFSTNSPGFPPTWRIMRSCTMDHFTELDWWGPTQLNGGYTHIVWIPRPCGAVRISSSMERVLRSGI